MAETRSRREENRLCLDFKLGPLCDVYRRMSKSSELAAKRNRGPQTTTPPPPPPRIHRHHEMIVEGTDRAREGRKHGTGGRTCLSVCLSVYLPAWGMARQKGAHPLWKEPLAQASDWREAGGNSLLGAGGICVAKEHPSSSSLADGTKIPDRKWMGKP